MELQELSKYGATGIAIAILIFFGYVFKCLLPIFKQFVETLTQLKIYLEQRNGHLERQLKCLDKKLDKLKKK